MSSNQIKNGAIISYITLVFTIVTGLLYTPWMISKIGQADFGLFTLATSLVTMVTVELGLSSAVTRFVSKYRAENDYESINQFLGITYKLFMLMSFVFLTAIIILYINVDIIFVKLTDEEIEKVKVLFSVAGLYAVFSFPFNTLDGLLISAENFVFQKSMSLLNRILTVSLMIIALMLGYGLYSLVVVNVICGVLIIGIKLSFIRKRDKIEINWKYFDLKLIKQIFSFSVWIMVISVAQRLILNITPSILGITSGSEEIAIFSAAMTLEGYIWTFSTVLSGMFLPKVSKLIYGANAEPEAIQELMIKVGRIQFILLAGIVSIFIMVGRDFFLNWLGASFEKSYLITVLLIIPGLITIPQEIASTTLIASNQVRYNAFSKIIVAVLSISLSIVFSLRYGSTGAGIAIFIGNLVGGVLIMNIIYVRILKINIWEFFRKCQLSMLIPFVLVIPCGFLLNVIILDVSWMHTFLRIMILLIVYAISAYFFALNNFEKKLIQGIIKK